MKNNKTLLEIKNLHTGFSINGQIYHAVDDVSFEIQEKEVICVVGESGCGKSVMSLSIMQLLPQENAKITKGEIRFNGMPLTNKTDKEMNNVRGKEISMIFQEPMTALNPVFTIGSQIQEVLHNHLDISKQAARKKSIALMKQVGISRPEKVVDEYPHQLSGGMRQRVMIAIAIALNPKLLIADEPTTALDVTVQAQILELLTSIQQEANTAIMLITHDLGVVAEMADSVMVMYAGQIVETSTTVELFSSPKHPYTEALLHSIPKMEEDVERLHTIGGIVPSLTSMPQVGCRFRDRCPKAFADCRSITPKLAPVGDGHLARCLLYHSCYPKQHRTAEEGVEK
ncbi:MAG: ABC transporter ATP-binding protein [Bacillota bacterium]|uniref:ABC transporter ATP-binding protein n=1 Tax=Virgibacillus salarius TaxID=447199 RepID=A0A941DUD8_9BACI|nr:MULTISPECIES: ABC transporter ATP-binding protein [Virgibacillus]NAZ09565.1 ATP-binding cassette domain-containing protein [Agaribacter marinus]MBR7796855.1 ABC transporter ATP-binding protein [Virgibacillus salarius]MCC2249978.1 ABC transporter ATP-binding protein [Virgibacillus sp. AGTR]MDY7044684.1 ABC transporter ATP-binding protein [Virgibacillus sp. M23]QRZ18166.1 ABC transporter ATP-binding protein [Virgibacillus sp. AGTR]